MNGIISIIKPAGYTSHDVVNLVRKKLMTKKVGHTGTLDPMALGVLPICVGKATKLVEYVTDKDKEYICEVDFNKSSDTLDIWGTVEINDTKTPEKDDFLKSFDNFIGLIEQVPPMYSAIKINGKKLYEYAREGKEIKRTARKIQIKELELLSFDEEKARFRIVSSKGTYVRSLIDDICKANDSSGIMSSLIRTRSGNFDLSNSITLRDFMNCENPEELLLSLDTPFTHLAKIQLPNDISKMILNGVRLDLSTYDVTGDTKDKRIYLENIFIGIAKYNNQMLKLDKLLIY